MNNSLKTPNDEEINKLKLELDNAKAKIADFKKQLQDVKAEANTIANNRNELKKQYDSLLNEYTQLIGTLKSKNGDVSKYKNELNDVQRFLAAQKKYLSNLATENCRLNNINKYLLNKDFQNGNEIDKLKGEIVANKLLNQEKSETPGAEKDDLEKGYDLSNNRSNAWLAKIIVNDKYKKVRWIIGTSLFGIGLLSTILTFVSSSVGMFGIGFGVLLSVASAIFLYGLSCKNSEKGQQKSLLCKKLSGLIFGIGLALLGIAGILSASALLCVLPQMLANIFYLASIVVGVYLSKCFYDIKNPRYQQNGLEYPFDSDIYQQYPNNQMFAYGSGQLFTYNQNQIQDNVNNQNISFDNVNDEKKLEESVNLPSLKEIEKAGKSYLINNSYQNGGY